VRWHRAEIPIDGLSSADDVMERVRLELERAAQQADDRLLAARVSLRGLGAAHTALQADPERWTNQIRQLASLVTAGEVWLEKIEILTRPALDLQELRGREDVVGDLARAFHRIRGNAEELAWLGEQLSPLWHQIPAELKAELGDLANPATIEALVDQVEASLLPRVLSDGSP
jgi:hypothetical protein